MFEQLSRFVVKRWYVIITIWILLIVISAPLSSLFLKSVSYQIAISIPGSTSQKAEQIVSNYFKLQGVSGSNAVLVVEGNVSKYSVFLSNLTSYGNISLTNYFVIEKDILNNSLNSIKPKVENLSNVLLNISRNEVNISKELSITYRNLTSEINKLKKLHNTTILVENQFLNVSQVINDTTDKLIELHQSMVNNYTYFYEIHMSEIQTNKTIYNTSRFLFLPVSAFLEVWAKAYNQTHEVKLSNQIAYNEISTQIQNAAEKEYFNLFYYYWNSSYVSPLNATITADDAVKSASLKFFNATQSNFILFILSYVNLTNYNNVSLLESVTVKFFNETYHVPIQLGTSLLYNNPLSVLVSLYSTNTNLPPQLLVQIFNSTNLKPIALNLTLSKVNSSLERDFIICVYENLSKSPSAFAIDYISTKFNITQSVVAKVSSFNSLNDYIYFVSSLASNKSSLPTWVFNNLITYKNITNLTAYITSTHLGKLADLLEKSNLTTFQLATLLERNVSVWNLSAEIIVNYLNVSNISPILQVNKTLLFEALAKNLTVKDLIEQNIYPIKPISNITDNLYSNNLFLIIMKGNFSNEEALQFENYIQSKLGVKTYLTGNEPISSQLKNIASEAYSTAIPVGIILAILLAGIYFRSFITAFMPLLIYISAYIVASVLLWLIVIKALGITVSYLTPSEVLLLSLGLGTDYVVFIASRYVEERKKGKDQNEAVYEAIRWGGRAVTVTALIVMLSFLFIYIYKIPFFSDTAIADIIGVIVVWLASITLFPAILRVAGDKLFYPRKFTKTDEDKKVNLRRPKLYIGIISFFVIISAIIASTMPLTLNILSLLPQSQATQGVTILSNSFTSANVFPIYVVVPYNGTFNQTAYNYAVTIYNTLINISGVTAVNSPVSPYGYLVNYSELPKYNYTEYISHGYMLFVVNQKYQPYSNEAFHIIHQIENRLKNAYIGGGPVDAYNIYNFVQSNFLIILAEISITMFIILYIMSRSLAVSGVIIYTILSAVSLTLALERMLFTSLLGASIFAVVPIFLVSIIIGIGMDYNIFLVARVHEELEKGYSMEDAVEIAVRNLRLTIAFLGLIFAGTLGALMLVKAPLLQELGFAFAVAAILETTVLWGYLSPSLLIFLYRKFKIRPKLLI